MEEQWPLASRKRLILAAYLDYLIFTAPWSVAIWLLSTSIPGFDREPVWVKWAIFVALEIILFRVVRWSPGQYLLGIVEARRAYYFEVEGPLDVKPTFFVNPLLLSRERWWTILIGVVLILDGSKAMVRWTQFEPPMPWFGVVPPLGLYALIVVAFGATEFCIGAGVLRLRRFVLPLALTLYAVQALSGLVSQSEWPEWAEKYVTARRTFQGVPVREGEVEAFQAFVPAIMVVAPVVALLLVSLVYWRARRLAAT